MEVEGHLALAKGLGGLAPVVGQRRLGRLVRVLGLLQLGVLGGRSLMPQEWTPGPLLITILSPILLALMNSFSVNSSWISKIIAPNESLHLLLQVMLFYMCCTCL